MLVIVVVLVLMIVLLGGSFLTRRTAFNLQALENRVWETAEQDYARSEDR